MSTHILILHPTILHISYHTRKRHLPIFIRNNKEYGYGIG